MTRLRLLSSMSLSIGLLLAVVVVSLGITGAVQAQGGDDGKDRSGGGMMPLSDRLAPPVMPEHPTQADRGAYTYYLVCMVCHGDRGQGLTTEWRSVGGMGVENCWQSKCHAANHPPEGFRLPTTVPPVIGNDILNGFGTAENLHMYISTRMPWQAPGSLKDDQYWQLTAFLARANNLVPADAKLTPDNAASFQWGAAQEASAAQANALVVPPATRKWVGGFVLVTSGLLLLAALVAGILQASRKRR